MRNIALAITVLVAFTGCLGSKDVAVGHRISGELLGLWHGESKVVLRLEAGGTATELELATDDPFTFARPLAPGLPYEVSVLSSPRDNECRVVAGGSGIIADVDITGVQVKCEAPPVSIDVASEPSSGLWSWTFDATQETQKFPASLFIEAVTITIDGLLLTDATVDGATVMGGKTTVPIELPLGKKEITIVLEWDGRLSRTFKLVFERAQTVYGKAKEPDHNDHLGASVALSEDTMAVGVPEDGDGVVYVFVRDGTGWHQEGDPLKGRNVSSARFGYSVALSGNTLVVGAPSNGADVGSDPGATYVFVRNGTTWSLQKELTSGSSMDRFGIAVAVFGDTVAVAAPATKCDTAAASIAGAVYVATRTGTAWSSADKVPQPDTRGTDDKFGCSLALSDDTLVVGAPGRGGTGAVYSFHLVGTVSSPQPTLKAENARPGDEFGASVALSGNTLAVGAPEDDSAGDNAGAAYVFDRNGDSWKQRPRVTASNAGPHDHFGTSIALSDKLLAVGSPGEGSRATGINGDGANDVAVNAGAVYVFLRNDLVGWSAYVKASNTGAEDEFGVAVAVSRDTLVVGADHEDGGIGGMCENGSDACMTAQNNDSVEDAGAIYIFR